MKELYNAPLEAGYVYAEACMQSEANGKIIIICGPTASCKSKFALEIGLYAINTAHRSACIINADAMQVYAGLSILTCQPSLQSMEAVEHRLYGHHSVEEFRDRVNNRYSVMHWAKEAVNAINEVRNQDGVAIVVGGTGMYIHSLVCGLAEIPEIKEGVQLALLEKKHEYGLRYLYVELAKHDPETASKISHNDELRIMRALSVLYSTGDTISHWKKLHHKLFYQRDEMYVCYMCPKRATLHTRINVRTYDAFTQSGCYDEFLRYYSKICTLLRNSTTDSPKPHDGGKLQHHCRLCIQDFPRAIGIREMLGVYDGKYDLNTAISLIQCATRQYARKQTILFNGKRHLYDVTMS